MYGNFVERLLIRRCRSQTRGLMLNKMTRALGGKKLPIDIIEGNSRPHDAVQASKFASEATIIVRTQVPIFAHLNQYKIPENQTIFRDFMMRLAVSMGILSVITFNCTLSN